MTIAFSPSPLPLSSPKPTPSRAGEIRLKEGEGEEGGGAGRETTQNRLLKVLHPRYSYSGSNIVADVSYDLWLAPTSGGSNKYEIMVWLAALGGAGPISSTGSAIAKPTIAGSSWSLYSGPNGDTTVYSFVASSEIESFSGDMMDFFNYLVDNEGVSDSMYITQLQAGTEPFTGSNAVFKTSSFTMSVK